MRRNAGFGLRQAHQAEGEAHQAEHEELVDAATRRLWHAASREAGFDEGLLQFSPPRSILCGKYV
jgi:hypothetical protein